jgi:hypothetical protein
MPSVPLNLVPVRARSSKNLAALERDNVCIKDWAIQIDEDRVWISEQPWGEGPKQKVEIPRRIFDAFVKWYTAGEVPRGDLKARKPDTRK